MTKRIFITVALLFAISALPAFAQLGPKEGANMASMDLDRVRPGQVAPDFALENLDGKTFTLSEFRGKKNVVLVFYRGHW